MAKDRNVCFRIWRDADGNHRMDSSFVTDDFAVLLELVELHKQAMHLIEPDAFDENGRLKPVQERED